jgi:hypothetical protein
MDDMKSAAKLKVLKHLKDMASGMMGDDIKGGMMKKVTVAAPDNDALKMGLDKAKSIVGHMPEADEDPEEELHETPEEESAEDHPGAEDDMSADEIDAEIQHLMELKSKLQEKT